MERSVTSSPRHLLNTCRDRSALAGPAIIFKPEIVNAVRR